MCKFSRCFLLVSFICAGMLTSNGARYEVNLDAMAIGTKLEVTGSGNTEAVIASNPSGTGNVIKVKCAEYGQMPVLNVALPDGMKLGQCSELAFQFYIPSSDNEQYANYKQLQVYIDGQLAYKDVKADGSDDYPKQGDKDKWISKALDISKLNGSSTIGNSFKLGLGLTDNAMTYYIKGVVFKYDLNLGDPVLPAQGAYYTEQYRNLFKEAGYSDAAVQQRIDELWATYFEGDDDTERLYYPVGNDMAYILDVNNNDVRTEGMSYGMMICLQLDKQEEFNKLWKWAKTYMQFPDTDERRGYFSWQCNRDGSHKGNTPASDGEEYFVMALMFASNRWGNGEGIYNYAKEANYILKMSEEKPAKDIAPYSSYTPLFDRSEMQVVFVPYASAATFTDPSYHLPAFYQLWGEWADTDNDFYYGLAAKSREMWPKFANAKTGLMPDYADFDGSPHSGDGDHKDFLYDAWRCMMNMGMDFAWFRPADLNYTALVNKILDFFVSKGVTTYHSIYTLDGQDKNGNTDHSPGLVACNASGALACDNKNVWKFVENFYDTAIPTGKYRYYDGCLYFMNWLNCAGLYKIYKPLSSGLITPESGADRKIVLKRNGTILEAEGVKDGKYIITSLPVGIKVAQGHVTDGIIPMDGLMEGAVYAVTIEQPGKAAQTIKIIY